jgi:hypothetical protein
MSSEVCEEMMALLQELAGLKEIDSQKRARTRQEKAARQERQRHRREIPTQIRELGEAKGNEAEQNRNSIVNFRGACLTMIRWT